MRKCVLASMLPENRDALACPANRLSDIFADPQDMTSQPQLMHSGGELKPCKKLVTTVSYHSMVTGAGMFLKVRPARIQQTPLLFIVLTPMFCLLKESIPEMEELQSRALIAEHNASRTIEEVMRLTKILDAVKR